MSEPRTPTDPTNQAREFDEEAFYNLMQEYRWMPYTLQSEAAIAFDNVRRYALDCIAAARAEGAREAQQVIAKRIEHLEFTHGMNNGHTDGSYDYDMEVAAALFELNNLKALLK